MLEGAFAPDAIAKAAKQLGFPAAAVVDRNGLYAAMTFSEACFAAGVQPIIGSLLAVARPTDMGGGEGVDWLALLAQNEAGYANLCRLVSKAHVDGGTSTAGPHVDFTALREASDGLICLTAGADGALVRLEAAGQNLAAEAYCDHLQAIFGDRLYIEVSRRGDTAEDAAEDALVRIAYAREIPLVATNACCFEAPDFHAAHDALLCIAQSTYLEAGDRRHSSPHAWLKPAEDMEDLFSDLPEAIVNTIAIAQRCGVRAPRRDPILPSIAGDREGEAAQLRDDARTGLIARLRMRFDGDDEAIEAQFPDYFTRLEFETRVITQMGFSGYFLIVADFIKWAKAQDIPVGPGRGSGAGSVVAWALTITDLDPLALGLLFERFLNPERISMPDFDIDFCETRRGEVIRYVQEKYGDDTVAQIITFGTMKARAVLKDTGRVLQMSYSQVDRLAKLVPNHPTEPWNLERALNGVAQLNDEYRRSDNVRKLFDMAQKLEGLPRHSSTHAAGVVIGDRPLAELVPLYRDPRSDMQVTQFDMKYVEKAGLVKFDFLGLKTLSVLKEAERLLALRGESVDLSQLTWDDPAVYALLQRGDTVGVFQLESEGMRRTLSAVRPSNFGDIIALVALYRPGPMDNIPLFGARKNGREPVEYPHPLLEELLAETYGIFVYQEQVMQAAQILAGYSLGGADVLRRAMGKKIQAEMDEQRSVFVTGCQSQHGIEPGRANALFDLIDKFAGYGFNKSHAAAYALLAYQTAWLKAHYPHEFFAASMSYDIHLTDKLSLFVEDMRRMDIAVLPPCINNSAAAFSVEAHDGGLAVRFGLGGLKGVGEKAMEDLVTERQMQGPFTSLDNFVERVDARLLNRRQMEALVAGGAMDILCADRGRAYAGAEAILAAAQQAASARETGQGGLFGGDDIAMPNVHLPDIEHWSLAEAMAAEREAFGFYFSAHPISQYGALTDGMRVQSFADICAMTPAPPGERRSASMAALVEGVKAQLSQRGNRYVQAIFSDRTGQFRASCFDEAGCAALEELAAAGRCALMQVEMDWREGDETPRIAVRRVEPLDELMARRPLLLKLIIECPEAVGELARLLADKGRGAGQVILTVPDRSSEDSNCHNIEIGSLFQLDQELVHRLERLSGVSDICLSLRPNEAVQR